MSAKSIIYIGAIIGGFIGGYIPAIWGAGYFSFSSIIFSMIGGLVGIYVAFKLTRL